MGEGFFATLLAWVIPSGGFGVLVGWLTSRRVREARSAKEEHDVYKAMLKDVNEILIEVNRENLKSHKMVARLERAFSRAMSCRHWDSCPVRDELQKYEGGIGGTHRKRQPSGRASGDDTGGCVGVESELDDPGGEPT